MLVSITIAACVAVLVATAAILRFLKLWWKFRGERLVTCPENLRPAGVRVDAAHVAACSMARRPQLQLSSCSRWPEKAGCGQECLGQVDAAPDDCLVRNILLHWYAGKRCACCGRAFGEIALAGAKPAVLTGEKVSVEWSEIPVERLPETLAASSPVCFACHLGNKLVRTHPELVVDRRRTLDRALGKSGE